MCSINRFNILQILDKKLSDRPILISDQNEKEEDIAQHLYNIIVQSEDCSDEIITETLDFEDNYVELDPNEISSCIRSNCEVCFEEEIDWSDTYLDPKKSKIYIEYNKKVEAVTYWRSHKKKKCRPFSQMLNKYKFIPNERALYRWENQIQQCGSRRDKLHKIWNFVLKKFEDQRAAKKIIHDFDIRKWALHKAREIGLNQFTASDTWLLLFKRNTKVVSRKILKYVSPKFSQNENDVIRMGQEFLTTVEESISTNHFSDTFIFNADQTGIQKEIHSGRTLTFKGERNVDATSQSLHSMTHSYTAMPIINKNGDILKPIFIVLQEPKWPLGERILNNLYSPKVLYFTATKSGKMGKLELVAFLKNCYYFNLAHDTKSLLLVDSWSTYNNKDTILAGTPTEKIPAQILQIPPKCTAVHQLLDVFFFRPFKSYLRKIEDTIIADELDFDIYTRNGILKLNDFVWNQISSPRFRPLIIYAWYKAGYIKEKPSITFQTFSQFCLNFEKYTCEIYNCEDDSFNRCSYCKLHLCANHSIIRSVHICEDYVE